VVLLAIRGNGLAIHVFHHNVGSAIRGGAAIEHLNNAGMVQIGKELSFCKKTAENLFALDTGQQHLDCDFLLIFVNPVRQIDDAHAALSELADDTVMPNLLTRGVWIHFDRIGGRERAAPRGVSEGQQLSNRIRVCLAFRTAQSDEVSLFAFRHFQSVGDDFLDLLPLRRRDVIHANGFFPFLLGARSITVCEKRASMGPFQAVFLRYGA
jgi:hypothetical protein